MHVLGGAFIDLEGHKFYIVVEYCTHLHQLRVDAAFTALSLVGVNENLVWSF